MKLICGVRYSRKAPNLSSSENKRTEVEGHSALSEEVVGSTHLSLHSYVSEPRETPGIQL